jgi:hypothetical protein
LFEPNLYYGATTLGIMTFSITTLSLKAPFVTLSIVTFSITTLCQFANFVILYIVMLIAVMLSVVMVRVLTSFFAAKSNICK